ncbi:MAG: hypothetical protein ABJ095_17730, partial [Nitratireductor sp.]
MRAAGIALPAGSPASAALGRQMIRRGRRLPLGRADPDQAHDPRGAHGRQRHKVWRVPPPAARKKAATGAAFY